MTDRRDYIALEWVAGEIADALAQCGPLIDDYLSNTNNASLDRVSMLLHQVQGSLRMVEFSGAALLVDEMERSILALSEGQIAVERRRDVLLVVQTSADELPAYLQRVKDKQHELPASLVMIFNDLRAALDQPLLSSSLLFNPPVNLSPAASAQAVLADSFNELASKLLKMYQIALQAYLRGDDDKQNLMYLGKVSGRAAKLCSGESQQVLWWSALALIEGLLNESIANHFAVRSLLTRLGSELQALVDGGHAATKNVVSLPLIKDILFYISSSPASSRYIQSEREKHGLAGIFDGATGKHDEVGTRFADLARPSVTAELLRLAAGVADNDSLLSDCLNIADALAVLGWTETLYPLNAIIEQVKQGVPGSQVQVVATSLQRLADRLSVVSDSIQTSESERDSGVESNAESVILYSRSVLFDAQEAIIAYVSEQWQTVHVEQLPAQLFAVAAQMDAAEFTAPAMILEQCAEYLANEIISKQLVPDWQTLDALADALTSVDYYLERSSHGRHYEDDALLAGAEACVARLGYPVRAVKMQISCIGRISQAKLSLRLAIMASR